MKDDVYIPEPDAAVVVKYVGGDWESALEAFYRKNPHLRQKVNVILLPEGGFDPFEYQD